MVNVCLMEERWQEKARLPFILKGSQAFFGGDALLFATILRRSEVVDIRWKMKKCNFSKWEAEAG
jgi:hypothetical protein